MQDAEIIIRGETLHLMSELAVYWPRTHTLFVADLHLGKITPPRWGAMPVPDGNIGADLARLSRALRRTSAKRLIVLGDLRHAPYRQPALVDAMMVDWRAAHADLKVTLVRGNHDRELGDPPSAWRVRCVDGPTPGPLFVLLHEPERPANPDAYALGGHIHPALEGDEGRQPIFWFRDGVGVLPAFSSLIWGTRVYPAAGEGVFRVIGEEVVSRSVGNE